MPIPHAENYLKQIIQTQGPLTVAQYMGIALSDPAHGYYIHQQPFGARGDFTTAPEISQMFGEMIGAWCVNVWDRMGRPESCALVELGPGRGALMNDLLRATQHVKNFHRAAALHLVEISPLLCEKQKETLAPWKRDIEWHDTIETLPAIPGIIVANEFFDALPIHQFIKTDKGWREKMVVLDEKGDLAFALTPAPTPMTAMIPKSLKNTAANSVYEFCPAALAITQHLTKHIVKYGGALLTIDYGYDELPLTESLQSVKNHQFHPVLETPGQADITAHVDFSALSQAAREAGGKIYGPIGQGTFLKSLGIELRCQMLGAKATGEQQSILASEYERLVSPQNMGTLFKVLAVTAPTLAAPEGFSDETNAGV